MQRVKMETRNGYYIFKINQKIKLLHTAFLILSFQSLLGLYLLSLPQKKSSYLCIDYLEFSKQFWQCQISG